MDMKQLEKLMKGKRVLFFTTKNLSYLRNVQEIKFIGQFGKQCKIIGSEHKSYLVRVLKLYFMGLIGFITFRPEVIFIGFAPQLVLPFLWIFKKLHKTVVVDFFISLYDTMIDDRKRFREKSLPAHLLYWLDKKTLYLADYYIVDTKADKEFFSQTFQADSKKGCVWYLCADASVYYPLNSPKRREWNDKFVVLYFGSILPLQGVEVVLEAIHRLQNNKTLQFVIIGPIDKLKNADLVKGQKNVAFYTWLSQGELAEKISMADLCLAGHFDGNIGKAKRTIPGKAYIYSAMEKKMILGDSPANHELYREEEENVYFVTQGDAEALAAKIEELAREGGYV